jgi:hypothetical protein
MNENIQKLYLKVLHESAERWNHPDAEKFAELIINECAQVADRAWNDAGTYPGNLVRKHFGIKQ